jgi:hypothetical protein
MQRCAGRGRCGVSESPGGGRPAAATRRSRPQPHGQAASSASWRLWGRGVSVCAPQRLEVEPVDAGPPQPRAAHGPCRIRCREAGEPPAMRQPRRRPSGACTTPSTRGRSRRDLRVRAKPAGGRSATAAACVTHRVGQVITRDHLIRPLPLPPHAALCASAPSSTATNTSTPRSPRRRMASPSVRSSLMILLAKSATRTCRGGMWLDTRWVGRLIARHDDFTGSPCSRGTEHLARIFETEFPDTRGLR